MMLETEKTTSPRSGIIFAVIMSLLTVVFLALGTWQVQRLFWKLNLIDRVEARVAAPPVPAPPSSAWVSVNADADEYRHVTATGTFRHDKQTLVQAVTDLGSGFWVLSPLQQADGTTILINRGFVPTASRDPASRAKGDLPGLVNVTGLLRITEPGGAFLRSNDPANDRWYSRDVMAISAAKRIQNAAPYFIDADSTPNPGGLPVGGLTMIRFRNSHLAYALTWYALAAMTVGATFVLFRKRLV